MIPRKMIGEKKASYRQQLAVTQLRLAKSPIRTSVQFVVNPERK